MHLDCRGCGVMVAIHHIDIVPSSVSHSWVIRACDTNLRQHAHHYHAKSTVVLQSLTPSLKVTTDLAVMQLNFDSKVSAVKSIF